MTPTQRTGAALKRDLTQYVKDLTGVDIAPCMLKTSVTNHPPWFVFSPSYSYNIHTDALPARHAIIIKKCHAKLERFQPGSAHGQLWVLISKGSPKRNADPVICSQAPVMGPLKQSCSANVRVSRSPSAASGRACMGTPPGNSTLQHVLQCRGNSAFL